MIGMFLLLYDKRRAYTARMNFTKKDLRDAERVVRGLSDCVFGILRVIERRNRRNGSQSESEGNGGLLSSVGEAIGDMAGRRPLYGAPSLERRIREHR